MTAIQAAYRAFTDPASHRRDMTHDARAEEYNRYWSFYRNFQYSRNGMYDWSTYLAARKLYKKTRLIYNPIPQIVDFYVDNLWQPAQNEEFESLVTPVSDKTDERITEAVAQLDQWGSALSAFQLIKRYGAGTGNVLVEGVDALERGKVLHKTVWPGYLTEIELNDTGDVQGYVLEYPVYDPASKKTFQFKKIVTKDTISYFRDDRPFVPEGARSDVEEGFGFCFAVWIRQTDDGADYGLPACHNLDKVDNVNSLASHIDDFIHKAIESPKVISTSGDILPIIGATRLADGSLAGQDPALNWMVLKTAIGADVHDLLGLLDLAAVSPELTRQLESFEKDYPELQAHTIIQKNSQLSGAALERMLGPAQNRLDGVQATWNQQLIKLRQMQIAVGGMRARGGGWTALTAQQKAFLPFNIDSYAKGDLNFNLKRSVLVQNTEMEDEELLSKKASRAVTMRPLIDRQEALSIAGYTDEQVKELVTKEPATVPPVIPEGLPENRQLGAANV